MAIKQSLLIFCFILFFRFGASQNPNIGEGNINQIIPPSPTAFQFSNYGNIPLNGSTGAFSYSVPLYEIAFRDLKVPISVNYFSNGVKIDDLSGVVGTDWSLVAGGAVSRTVRDYPDDTGTRFYRGIDEIDLYDETGMDVFNIKNIARDLQYGSAYDGEQDWFSFSAGSISGKFYFDEDLTPHIVSDQRVNISYILNDRITEFTIVDENGYKYIFGGTEDYWETSLVLNQCDNYPDTGSITSWFVKKIISPNQNEIEFEYQENELYYNNSYSVTASASGSCNQPDVYFPGGYSINGCLNAVYNDSKLVSSINFGNGSVEFFYESDRPDLYSPNLGYGKYFSKMLVKYDSTIIKEVGLDYDFVDLRGVEITDQLKVPFVSQQEEDSYKSRLFLKSIYFRDNNTGSQIENSRKYSFDYVEKDKLPYRLSFSHDKYGYNNGSVNDNGFDSNLSDIWDDIAYLNTPICSANLEVNPDKVFYGMLNKITYPTGGHTEISYEANSDTRINYNVPLIENLYVNRYGSQSGIVSGEITLPPSDGTAINLNLTTMYTGQPDGDATNDMFVIQVYKDNQLLGSFTNQYEVPYETSGNCVQDWFSPGSTSQPICTEVGSVYKFVLSLLSDYAYGHLKINYGFNTEGVEEIFYGAGARVKEIVDFSNDNNHYNKRSFYYNGVENYPSLKTNLQHYYDPVFTNSTQSLLYCPTCSDEPCFCFSYDVNAQLNYSLSSSSINSNYTSRTPMSYYKITEFYEDSSLNTKGAIERKFSASPSSPAFEYLGDEVYGAPPSNLAELTNDKIQIISNFDENLDIVSKKQFNYELVDNDYLSSISAKRNYLMPWDEDYLQHVPPLKPACAAEEDFPPLVNYSVWFYKNYYGVHLLNSVIETSYFDEGEVESVVNYEYGPSPYYRLESETSFDSKGTEIRKQHNYPLDLVGVEQSPFMQDLVDENRIAQPVITETFFDDVKVSESHIKYGNSALTGNLLKETEYYSNKGPNVIDLNGDADKVLSINRYDGHGNILEYSKNDGTVINIIWGYDNSFPIAKIENASYSEFSAQISNLQSLSDQDVSETDEDSLRSALENLRASLPNAMVTTYTYDPLIGVTSITDSKGYKTYYEYDEYNRLKFIRDSEGNIVSESEYHYKEE